MSFNRYVFTLFLCAHATACVPVPAHIVDIAGRVLDENSLALEGTSVCQSGTDVCVSTDATGAFVLTYTGDPVGYTALTFSRAGYATQTRLEPLVETASPTVMRKVDLSVLVTLPEPGQKPVVVSTTRQDALVALSVPANALVDKASSQVVSGEINVAVTFWHPTQSFVSAPANLLAENARGGAPIGLTSLGMAQFELTQHGNLLQVAPGHTLTMRVVEPPSVTAVLQRVGARGLPNLYSLDENTGYWHLEGSIEDGAVAYDGAGGFTAQLPHLSSWNLDDPPPATPLTPTCVQGNVRSACDSTSPLTNAPVSVWFMGYEQLVQLTTTSDSHGHYCKNLDLSFIGSQQSQGVPYFVSGASYSNTSMFASGQNVPYPAYCFDCQANGGTYSNGTVTLAWCSACSCSDCEDAASQAVGLTDPYSVYYPTTGAFTTSLSGGTSCAVNDCVQLEDVTLQDANCATVPPLPPLSDPCVSAAALKQGNTCTPGVDVCCPRSGPNAVVCLDYLCVPAED